MAQLLNEQRDRLFHLAAQQVGLHPPILSALHQVQLSPILPDGERGLGISPAHRLPLEAVNTFLSQTTYAASTLRSLYKQCLALGWQPSDLWDLSQGCYSDRLIQTIAQGFVGQSIDPGAARLEVCDASALKTSYLNHVQSDYQAHDLALNWLAVEEHLQDWLEQVSNHYWGLFYQRSALLELVRLWQHFDTQDAACAYLTGITPTEESTEQVTHSLLDTKLLQFVAEAKLRYAGYPHQREAILCAMQQWQQLASRSQTIAALQAETTTILSEMIWDSALMAVVQRIPYQYQGISEQRYALVTGFQIWYGLKSQSETLMALGLPSELFTDSSPNDATLAQATQQLDRALLQFTHQIPLRYQSLPEQRAALMHLVQLWRGINQPAQVRQSLVQDLQQMSIASRYGPDAMPRPYPISGQQSELSWHLNNLDLLAPILPQGSFTWADATLAGIYLPPNQAVINAIVRMARQIQEICDRLQRPLCIVRWYCPKEADATRITQHSLGAAITFYCPGLTAKQIYWFLDPWWQGGLGCYLNSPLLCYVDDRSVRVRLIYDQSLNFKPAPQEVT